MKLRMKEPKNANVKTEEIIFTNTDHHTNVIPTYKSIII
jgi:hypothetical protein